MDVFKKLRLILYPSKTLNPNKDLTSSQVMLKNRLLKKEIEVLEKVEKAIKKIEKRK